MPAFPGFPRLPRLPRLPRIAQVPEVAEVPALIGARSRSGDHLGGRPELVVDRRAGRGGRDDEQRERSGGQDDASAPFRRRCVGGRRLGRSGCEGRGRERPGLPLERIVVVAHVCLCPLSDRFRCSSSRSPRADGLESLQETIPTSTPLKNSARTGPAGCRSRYRLVSIPRVSQAMLRSGCPTTIAHRDLGFRPRRRRRRVRPLGPRSAPAESGSGLVRRGGKQPAASARVDRAPRHRDRAVGLRGRRRAGRGVARPAHAANHLGRLRRHLRPVG